MSGDAPTAQVTGTSARSVEDAIRDGLARAAARGAEWARITAVSARLPDGRREQYRVGLVIGFSPA